MKKKTDIALKHIKRLFLAFGYIALFEVAWQPHSAKKIVPYIKASINNVIFCPLQHFVPPPRPRGDILFLVPSSSSASSTLSSA